MKPDNTLIAQYNKCKKALGGQGEAFHVLQHVLNIRREDIVLNADRLIVADEIEKIETILQQRAGGRPLSNILQVKEFWGRAFKTTSDTLDPRADSETLIRAVLQYCPDKNAALNMLDIGTGTGCLIISLLCEYKNATGTAIDISEKALDIAQFNAHQHEVDDHLQFLHQEWGALDRNTHYDLIISNPPYISPEEKLGDEVLDYDPHLALFAEDNGLRAYSELAAIIPGILNQNGLCVLEIGMSQASDVTDIFTSAGLSKQSLVQDLAGRDRCLVFKKT